MMDDKVTRAVNEFVAHRGTEALLNALGQGHGEASQLTIVSDEMMHRVPQDLIIGEKYVFSKELLDASSNAALELGLRERLKDLFVLLKSRRWNSVRLVFSGHALLSAHVKLLVYRVTHLETEDYAYFGESGYRRIKLNLRRDLQSFNYPSSAPK